MVDGVSFSIRPGEILGFLGPNGAGKSTTLKMMIGLVEPSQGSLLFYNEDVLKDLQSFQKRIGYVAEEAHLYSHLTGRECLQLAGRLRGLPRTVLTRRIDSLLQLFGIRDDGDTAVRLYSKGMRQKILLAGALLHDPELLILDEPFSGLDVNAALVLRSLLRTLAAHGKMILYSSHVLDTVEKLATSVLVIQSGRVIAYDSVANVRNLASGCSLEKVFAELTNSQDADAVAELIFQAVQS